jgi:hypothetical protein
MRWVQGRVVGSKYPDVRHLISAGLILFASAVAVRGEDGERDAIAREVSELRAELERAQRRVTELEGSNILLKPELSWEGRLIPIDPLRKAGAASGSSPNSHEQTSKQIAHSSSKPQPLSREQEEQLTKAGNLLRLGDVAGARLLLEHLLSTGSPVVAFQLAETYDPKRLSAWKVFGVRADPERARDLYQKAQTGDVKEGGKPSTGPHRIPR